MKSEFTKMIDSMTDGEFIKMIENNGCPKNYGLEGYSELCEHKGDASCSDCWREALNCKETKATLKTWEMIKELTENPEKKFRIKNGELETYVTMKKGDRYNVIIWQGEHQVGQKFAVTDEKSEWEEVKQPVTWQEALEAWANGEDVRLKTYDIEHVIDFSNLMLGGVLGVNFLNKKDPEPENDAE